MANSIIKKCLFPAAGYGTKFLPATKATPKEFKQLDIKTDLDFCGSQNK